MLSTSKLYSTVIPKLPNVYTGKKTQELNKRQNYNKLHRKPKGTEDKLPTSKNTEDELVRSS